MAKQGIYTHNLLIIHSYHPDMQWVKEVQQGLDETLFDTLGGSVDIKVEYMDSKRYASEESYELLSALWHHKYKSNTPDVIIVCDDNALNLVLQLRDKTFSKVPVVFCGVNFYDAEKLATVEDLTGVVEAYDLRGTLDIIKQLAPERDNLFIINDDTTSGRANKARLEEISYEYADHFRFMYSGTVSMATLGRVVQSLTDDTAILLMSYNRDSEDKILRYRDAARIVRENSEQPIFGVWSFYLGKGIVGGSLVNGHNQGQKAAELAIKILQGSDADDLPVVTESPNQPMFDYQELARFSIPHSLLPPKSEITGAPDSPWHRHRNKILLAIFLLVVQTLIIVMLFYNISMRKKSQQRLLKNQQNLSITLEAIGEAVISVDSEYQIVQANSSAANLLAIPLAELPGRSLFELLEKRSPDTWKQLAELVKRCCQSGEVVDLPEKTLLKSAQHATKHLSGSCSPIRDHSGKIVGAVLICHDITERESMRAMLAHSQKMEAIGQLAGGVAHDFNNLLAGISGFAEILSLQLQEDEKKLAHAQKILNAAGRAKDLTRQLLSFARKGKVISSPVDCHEALLTSIGLLERSINKNITITKNLHAQRRIILGDPVQLENLFLNLGINSADAMPDGGNLAFTTINEEIREEITCEFGDTLYPGHYLIVCVADTGCGIDDESRQVIFEPFYTTKHEGKGTGLGLSAVFGTMKEHGGHIQLFSKVGEGTEFKLYFPITDQEATQSLETIPLPGGNETILVVDDENLVLSSTEAILNELGYQVIAAEGGTAGIEEYRRDHKNIDLVLLDMIMPGIDGAECYAELKKINPAVKVIISSGFAKTARIREVEQLGALDFLQKPYSATALSRAIREAVKAE